MEQIAEALFEQDKREKSEEKPQITERKRQRPARTANFGDQSKFTATVGLQSRNQSPSMVVSRQSAGSSRQVADCDHGFDWWLVWLCIMACDMAMAHC
jgi:hypothetical protein